jgi:hypothetical protein
MRRMYDSLEHKCCVLKSHPNMMRSILAGKFERGLHEDLAKNGI